MALAGRRRELPILGEGTPNPGLFFLFLLPPTFESGTGTQQEPEPDLGSSHPDRCRSATARRPGPATSSRPRLLRHSAYQPHSASAPSPHAALRPPTPQATAATHTEPVAGFESAQRLWLRHGPPRAAIGLGHVTCAGARRRLGWAGADKDSEGAAPQQRTPSGGE